MNECLMTPSTKNIGYLVSEKGKCNEIVESTSFCAITTGTHQHPALVMPYYVMVYNMHKQIL